MRSVYGFIFATATAFGLGVLDVANRAWTREAAPPAAPTVTALMSRDIVGAPNQEALMMTVTYQPGGSSLPHRHDAQVFVYVLAGTVTMQVDGGVPMTLGTGQTFFEGPTDVHRLSANVSQTKPAQILVFMIKDKGRPISTPPTPKEAP